MRALRRVTILALPLMLAMGTAAAAPTGYASAFDGLYQIDLATAQATRIGTYGPNISDIEGLTFLPDGTLIGASDSNRALYRLSVGSSRGAFLATLSSELRELQALDLGFASGCDGTMYVSSDFARKLWRLGTDGSSTFIADLPASISGLAFRDNMLYGVSITPNEGTHGEGLWKIDPQTGAATLVGSFTTPRPVRDAGLDFDASGRLWAVFDYNPPTSGGRVDFSDLAEIDPRTGALISRRPVSSGALDADLEGLAVAPPVCTPEGFDPAPVLPIPAGTNITWLALGLGFIAVAFAALRRRVSR